MALTPEQTADFESKMLKLADFANSIGLKITKQNNQNNKPQRRETAPEELKISGVRNLVRDGTVDNVCYCKITRLEDPS